MTPVYKLVCVCVCMCVCNWTHCCVKTEKQTFMHTFTQMHRQMNVCTCINMQSWKSHDLGFLSFQYWDKLCVTPSKSARKSQSLLTHSAITVFFYKFLSNYDWIFTSWGWYTLRLLDYKHVIKPSRKWYNWQIAFCFVSLLFLNVPPPPTHTRYTLKLYFHFWCRYCFFKREVAFQSQFGLYGQCLWEGLGSPSCGCLTSGWSSWK